MKKENKGLSILANLDILIAAAVLAVLVVLTFLGVIWRYFLAHPFTWLEEVQMACMVWIGRRRLPHRQPCGHRDGRGSDAEKSAEGYGNFDWYCSVRGAGIPVLSEYRIYPDLREERTCHQHAQDPLLADLRYRTGIVCGYDHQLCVERKDRC